MRGLSFAGVRVGSLRGGERDRFLADARAAAPTYSHVGSTLDPDRWSAPGTRHRSIELGTGDAVFRAARHALQSWAPQVAIGAAVEPAGQAVEVGVTILLVLRRGPLFVVAPARIIAVADQPRRFAYAYGTLPGHPERGEESFTIDHLDAGSVRATIRVRATAGTLAAQAAAPLVRHLQAAALDAYLRAIADHVAAATGGHDGPGEAA